VSKLERTNDIHLSGLSTEQGLIAIDARSIFVVMSNARRERTTLTIWCVPHSVFQRCTSNHYLHRTHTKCTWKNQKRMHQFTANSPSLLSHGSEQMFTHTHTHTHPFNGPLSGTTRVSRYQKIKTNLDFTVARDSEWQWHQLGHVQVCTSLQTDNHANTPPLGFFTGRMPFLPPNQQRQSTEGNQCLKE